MLSMETKPIVAYVRLTPSDESLLQTQAEKEDRPKSDVLRRALRAYVKAPPEQAKATAAELAGRWLLALPLPIREAFQTLLLCQATPEPPDKALGTGRRRRR